MGVVPQEIAIYEEISGRENLEFWGQLAGLSKSDARSRATELLASLQLTDRGNDAVKKYSGGMKRRINIGCALMHRPKLLLLDEPTVGIDPQARPAFLGTICALFGFVVFPDASNADGRQSGYVLWKKPCAPPNRREEKNYVCGRGGGG
jgi:ABC-2 type transport system ATP-binding protein